MVAASCLRCGDTFTAQDQGVMGDVFAAHQADRHSGQPPMFSFTQPEDPAVTQAAQAAAQQQQVLDGNAATMSDRVNTALANLETAAQNWGTLTAVQKDNALRLTVQVVCRLARLVLRKLDTAT